MMRSLRPSLKTFTYNRNSSFEAIFPKRWDAAFSQNLKELQRSQVHDEERLPSTLYIYILMLLWATSALVGWSLTSTSYHWSDLLHSLPFAAAIFLSDLYPLRIPTGENKVTLSCAFKTATAIACGPQLTVLITLLGTAMTEIVTGRKWYKGIFNVSAMVLTSVALSAVYYTLSSIPRDPFHSPQNGVAVLALVVTYSVISVGLVSILMSLLSDLNPFHFCKKNLRNIFLNNLTIIPVGALIAHLWMYATWTVLAVGVPMAVAGKSFQFIDEFRAQTHRTLVRMADAIDERTPRTSHHARRVATISRAIGREMGLSEADLERLTLAARLHDLGKIGMSDNLDHETEHLDTEEMESLVRHPVVGSKLLGRFRFFKEGREIVLHHHEHYDGSGYPDGLAGKAIPLGSRIIALADTFDRLWHRRANASPTDQTAAFQQILDRSGSQFDPQVVDAFVKAMESKALCSTLAALHPVSDQENA
ncbi:MAG: HD-GYP domain-containing protein [Anaerolineae bacterium]